MTSVLAAARSVVDRIAAEVGPPEVLVNAVGMFHPGDALTVTQEDLRLMIDVNLGAALWLTQAVAPYMRERGSGSIVHVAARPGRQEPSVPPAGPAGARGRAGGDRRHHRLPRERRRAGQRCCRARLRSLK